MHGTGIGVDRSDTKRQRIAEYFVSRSGYVPLYLPRGKQSSPFGDFLWDERSARN